MTTPLSDSEIISGCLAGNNGSWEAFVDRFSKLIHWSVRRTLERSPLKERTGLADEVFQEIFERLLDRGYLGRMKDVRRLGKFLSVMACHAALDKVRALARAERQEEGTEEFFEGIPDASKDPAAEAVAKEEGVVFEEVLGALKPVERACVEFHYLDGQSHREISDLLGISQDTVSTVIRRTREKLKRRFTEKGLGGWMS